MRTDEERIYTLTFISRPFLSEKYMTVETVEIKTEDCHSLDDVVESFNKLLKVMGFQQEVEIVEKIE
jgi:hypothetical protein